MYVIKICVLCLFPVPKSQGGLKSTDTKTAPSTQPSRIFQQKLQMDFNSIKTPKASNQKWSFSLSFAL